MIRRRPKQGGRVPRIARPTVATLAPEWRVWAAENLLAGRSRQEVASALVAHGVQREEAAAQVAAMLASPVYEAALRYVVHSRRLELVARLLAEHARTATHPGEVERRDGLSPDDFFTRYYATSTPVVLTDVVTRWPALQRWTPEYFRTKYGEVTVQAAFGRDGDPDYDMNTPKLSREVPLRDFIDRVLAAGESNDLYLVANNRNMDREALQSLYDDVAIDARVLDPRRYRGSVALWIGPAGTVTPLHHDTANILFAQVYGQKRFMLMAPWEMALFHSMRGVYNTLDPEHPDPTRAPGYERVTVKTVTLSPGDMLFIPAGWWHHVRALSVSINIALTNFTRNNAFDWFRPGSVKAPRG